MTIGQALDRLQTSAFRARFHLSEKERAYIAQKGLPVIRDHAADFVRTRLSPAEIPNDGKQTPMRGHPVFVAQHACACCCRGCLEKWYHIPAGVELTEAQQQGIVNLLMAWIRHDLEKGKPVGEKNQNPITTPMAQGPGREYDEGRKKE